MKHILIIEDEPLIQRILSRLVTQIYPGARIKVVDNAPDAISYINNFALDYIISDYDLRIGTGGDVLRYVRTHFKFYCERSRFIILSANVDAVEALAHPLSFDKPCSMPELRKALTGGQAFRNETETVTP